MNKKVIYLFIITLVISNILTGCNKINELGKKQTNYKKIENTKDENIVDEIEVNIESIKQKKDYEDKDTLILKVSFKNLSKDIKILDSQDITLTQGGHKLKYTYDETLKTEAFYTELNSNKKKTVQIGFKLEGDNKDIKLIYKPFLSKNKLQIQLYK